MGSFNIVALPLVMTNDSALCPTEVLTAHAGGQLDIVVLPLLMTVLCVRLGCSLRVQIVS